VPKLWGGQDVAQLIQSISQLALPLSQEGAKKKRWWQFWK